MYLFLDRDGVINNRKVGGYIQYPDEFVCAEGVIEAMPILAKIFEKIVVVTNQQGIGKGLMTEGDLAVVHQKMEDEIKACGGRIDAVLHCPHLKNANCACRKPLPGMAFQAKEIFPEIRFSKSWMAGDSYSDIAFGLELGMRTFFIKGKKEDETLLIATPKLVGFENLLDFANYALMNFDKETIKTN